ncbi:uncharacterized protein LOC136064361 [Quercus suber]|uniref:uncharacterized protein LOC136064361 n=1 Tax=Quercus suber TaxID=58331 RepID=UPI0032DF8CAE
MSSPEPDEVLFAYIAVAPYAVSLVLIRVDRGVQMPVYYMSKLLHEAEIRYLPLEKAILAEVLERSLILGGICRRCRKPKRIWSEASVISLEKIVIEKSLRLGFMATNNEDEYEALLMGMTMVQRMGGKSVEIFSDSRLVVGQVQGEFEVKDERMQEFESFNLLHIPKNGNAHADSLATLATSSA